MHLYATLLWTNSTLREFSVKATIRLYRPGQEKTLEFSESTFLALSWGSVCQDFQLDQEISKDLHSGSMFLDEFGNSTQLQDLLSDLDVQDEILILPLCCKDEVAEYVLENEKIDSRISSWHIVYNNFARHTFLGSNRSLSLDIPNDTKLWLKDLIEKYSVEKLLAVFDGMRKDIILLGETILDEYVYCEALGKVSKDPLIAFHKKETVVHLGGILAAAAHIDRLSGGCHVVSEVNIENLDEINDRLPRTILRHFTISQETSQVTKTRYVDTSSNVRVFETYAMTPESPKSNQILEDLDSLVKSTGAKELVIIDFGHGLLSNQAIEFLLAQDLNISVNAQSNAGNRGFNPISRYKGAKRIFINGTELELEARKRTTNREFLIQEMVPALNCEELYVTQGAAGILYWTSTEGVKRAPGFSPTIVDRVGAGDALLSTISTLRANNVPIDIASFYGNIAGAVIVSLLGNSTSISKAMLLSEAEAILRSVGK